MQNSTGLNKNILVLTIVLFALVASLSVMIGISNNLVISPAPILEGSITQAIDKNVVELNNLDADLALLVQDDVVSQELDATLSEVGEIDEVSTSLTSDEKNLTDLDNDLNNLSNDEKVNAEVDQSLQDASL
jgi:hypothetical protein